MAIHLFCTTSTQGSKVWVKGLHGYLVPGVIAVTLSKEEAAVSLESDSAEVICAQSTIYHAQQSVSYCY